MDTDNPPDPALIEDLVLANRILADQGVLDGFGHVSARHDKYPDRFLMSQSSSKAGVKSFVVSCCILLERFPHASCRRRTSLYQTFNDVCRLTVNKRFDP
jgi:hypothetical protein